MWEYGLPVNFTCRSMSCFYPACMEEQHKICINLIYTAHDAYLMSLIMSLLNCLLLGVRD